MCEKLVELCVNLTIVSWSSIFYFKIPSVTGSAAPMIFGAKNIIVLKLTISGDMSDLY